MSLLNKALLISFAFIAFLRADEFNSTLSADSILNSGDTIYDVTVEPNIESDIVLKIKVTVNKALKEIEKIYTYKPRAIKTSECKFDKYNTEYCPLDLVPCGKKWDYKDGFSEEFNKTKTIIETTNPTCPSGTIKYNGKCYLDKNHDGKITSSDKMPISVSYWTYIQHQDGKFYRYTEAHLKYPVKMSISWGGDDYHFGAKIKYKGKLVWSSLLFPAWNPSTSCVTNVRWDEGWVKINGTYYTHGEGDFGIRYSGCGDRTKWRSVSNLGNVVGDYFFIFFKDGGKYVADDYITVNFYTTKPVAPFDLAQPVNPTYCPAGYHESNHYCYKSLICPDDYSYVDGICKLTKTLNYKYYIYLCEGYNDYNQIYRPLEEGGDCNPENENELIDTNGDGVPDSCNSPTPPPNNCRALSFVCLPSPDRKCSYVNNQWQCSPFECNSDNMCGFAFCADEESDTDNTNWVDRAIYFQNFKFNDNKECKDKICDLTHEYISSCGKAICPKGFGVFEKDGKCYKYVCPQGSLQDYDGSCYKLKCPDGYISIGDDRCQKQ